MHTWGKSYWWHTIRLVSLCGLFLFAHNASAATISQFSDTLSDSAPGEHSNHTVEFRTSRALAPGGYIRITPAGSEFTVPGATLTYRNADLYVNSGSGFTYRPATSTVSTSTDGVTIVPGANGSVTVTLNSTTGIPANSRIRLIIGDETINATTTDTGILNPSASGSKQILIETHDGSTVDSVTGLVAIIDQVGLGPVDTSETIPPLRFNGRPTGTLSGTSQNVQMSLETNEFANCRYSESPGIPYFSMSSEFETDFVIIHEQVVSVATNTAYTYYIRCIDDEGNFNTDDFIIAFDIPEFPEGTPGEEGTEEGEGEGTGEGSGEADPGTGDPEGADDTSGGSSGGGGGGGGGGGSGPSEGGDDGGGGFEGTERPYQSGDARVIINGYAFPNSTVYFLVDGQLAETEQADSSGDFSATLDAIASGSYTFGIYAIDRNGVRSTTFSTTFSVIGSRGSTLSNVNITPSVTVSPDPVQPGQTLTISGYTVPNADVTIENQSDRSSITLKTFNAVSNAQGLWSVEVDSTSFTTGTYKARARATQTGGDNVTTEWSGFTFYGVGQEAERPMSSDLNRDGFVNLIDFSILLFWWNTDGGTSNPPADINQDGTVSLTDFSIMIFNWTG